MVRHLAAVLALTLPIEVTKYCQTTDFPFYLSSFASLLCIGLSLHQLSSFFRHEIDN